MKTGHLAIFAAGIIASQSGCISSPIALSPVGPDAHDHAVTGTKGNLEVFTATEKSVPFTSDDPTSFNLHTGYDIKDAAGSTVRFVANHLSNMDESPNLVNLLPGTYTIVAESTCCGMVSVPVIIEAGKTTVLHLDRNWFPPANVPTNRLVYLPDGGAVGWTVSPEKSSP